MFAGILSNYQSLEDIESMLDIQKPVSMVFEHRLALAPWLIWSQSIKEYKPNLITFDQHRDLTPLNEGNLQDVVNTLLSCEVDDLPFKVSNELESRNDTQISAACYMNIFKDVYVITHDIGDNDDIAGSKVFVDNDITDRIKDIMKAEKYILDIDLDYFFIDNKFEQDKVDSFLSSIKINLENLVGITLAIEPTYCGGIVNAIKAYEVLESELVTEPIFIDPYQSNWRFNDKFIQKD